MSERGQGCTGRRLLLGLGCVVVLGVSTPGLALDPHRLPSQYSLEAWHSEDGLPQNTVLAVQQTREGYLWFGTWEGLVRFDGSRFTVYDRHNTPELAEHSIQALRVDDAGRLWVGTKKGVVRYENGRFSRLETEGELRPANVTALVHEGSTLWVGSSLGLEQVPLSGGGARRRYTLKEGLPADRVDVLAVDEAGAVWLGTPQGLARLSGGTVEPVALPPGLDTRVRALLAARDGTLWVGTLSGLVSLRDGRVTAYGPGEGLPVGEVSELWEDRDGNLWVGHASGLLRRTAPGFARVGIGEGLAGVRVNALFEDREGSLWVGTAEAGLHRLRAGPFLTYGVKEGLAHDFVRVVRETQDGTLWVGTLGGGLNRLQGGHLRPVGAAEGLGDDNIRALAEGPDGTLWVGTHQGAFRYDGQRFSPLQREDGPWRDVVWAILPDSRGDVWFGTSAGLVRLSEGRFTLYTPEQGPVPEAVICIVEDGAGTLWFGTHAGLVRYTQGTFTRVAPEELGQEAVLALYPDPSGGLWVGTANGLMRLKDGKLSRLTVAQGLHDDTVFTLLPDEDGHLWMSSNKGISRVVRRELQEVMDGKRERVRALVFDERDGLRTVETSSGSQPAGWRARDGRLWFATSRGVAVVDPRDARLERRPPEVHIEEVRVQGQPVPRGPRLELGPDQQELSIRFTAFGVEGPRRMLFRYRLEGYDRDWVDAEGRRVASYTRLPPGTYRFQVRVADREGVWQEPGAWLEVKRQAWFYQTGWFYLLCMLGLGGVAAGGYGWRVGRLKARERWLHARVEERTKELARANQELDAHLRTLRATQAQLVQAGKMAAVGTLAAGVGHEINNPLSYIVSNLEHACEEASGLNQRPDGVPDEVRERLREMEQVLREALMGADRVRRIVRDLKTFSRQDEDTRGPVDLRAVMDSAAKLAAGELRPRAQLIRDFAADVPRAEGNEPRLAQVFLNLIINAAQALPEGQPERHEVRLVTRRLDDAQVVAEVHDTGSGIPPEVLGRIFDPFFTTKPVGVGTGLGLALCHAFVTSMGGRIDVESQVGRGTVFRVTLPVARGEVGRAQRTVVSKQEESMRGRVLVVDDDPLVSSALRRTLAREHDVEVVVSSRRALEMLKSPEGLYDVILCDLMMPEMTGMELHAQLSAVEPERARRMVFVTGGAYTPAAQSFLERVSNPRLEKPFEPDKLRAQVREWVAAVHASPPGA